MAIDRGKKEEEVGVDELLGDLEKKLERVKILYEQYFMGIEKMEPSVLRKEFTRKMLDLTQLNIRNTAQRYRLSALNQKFGVYTSYWSRTMQQIERGTYFRNVVKVARDAVNRGVEAPDEVLRALPLRVRERILRDRVVASAQAERARAAKPGRPDAAAEPPGPPDHDHEEDTETFEKTFDSLFDSMVKKPAPPAQAPSPAVVPGMDEGQTRELYRRFVEAKQLLGQPTEGLKYEQVVATLQKQAPKILADHKASAVEFHVVVKDGKVILRASPKK